MKKIVFLALITVSLSSCYNVKYCTGSVNPNDPVVKVGSVRNHHFIAGLVPGGKTSIKASEYVGNRDNYVVKNNWSFLDGFLSCITFGIYTPTTTTFYVPIDDVVKK